MPIKKFEADDTPVDGGDVWTIRLNALGYWAVKILGVFFTALAPVIGVIVLWYQSQLHTKLDTNTAEVKAVASAAAENANDAAENAKKAARETKAVGDTLHASVEERRDEFSKIEEGQKANLQAWKAYHTGDKGDMNKASEVIAKVIQEK